MTSFGMGPSRASALIFNGRGEYLLHLRDDVPGIVEPGAWSLLGGGREPGDRSPAETIRRELREEAGLELPVLEPFAVDEVVEGDTRLFSVQIFAGRWDGDPSMLTLTEGIMLHWFRPDVLPRLRIAPSIVSLVLEHARMIQARP
ncbi:NUDIX domain-containing protein [Actinomadura nitritigenes]|uniref:NUDIX domain-containing protein n=1 Tax=Actinomadura nitritigenes TaxID=134602 RepID=UPI003D94D987